MKSVSSIALLLAMGGVVAPLLAQGPRGDSTDYALSTTVGSALDRVCVGDSVVLKVLAVDHGQYGYHPMEEVVVRGSVVNLSNGTLEPASSKTFTLSPQENPSAVFTFGALLPGRTELRFTGMLATAVLKSKPRAYIPLKMHVNIVDCRPQVSSGGGSGVSKNRTAQVNKVKTISKVEVKKMSKVKVTTTSTWSVGMVIVASIDGVMDADDHGHLAGSAEVTWQTSGIGTASCGASERPTPTSKADLTGEIDASNQLVVTITFQPRDFSGLTTCGPVTRSTGNVATPDPVTVRVATTGGTSTQPHGVTARNGAFAGSVTVVVTPEGR
jgi:hypothetical protein